MRADGSLGAIVVGVGHDVHFRKVVLALTHAKQFGFKERETGIAPACTGTVLILDGRDGQFLCNFEDVAFLFRFLFVLSERDIAGQQCGGYQ